MKAIDLAFNISNTDTTISSDDPKSGRCITPEKTCKTMFAPDHESNLAEIEAISAML